MSAILGAPEHTPGRWRWIDHADGDYRIIVKDESRVQLIATAHDVFGDGLANARLIAATPELLALATAVLEAWDRYEHIGPGCTFENGPMIHASTLEELVDTARAALAKAKGEA